MSRTIEPAGYIVTDNETIWGGGWTSDDAWRDMLHTIIMAGIYDDMIDNENEYWWQETPVSQFKIKLASEALVTKVREAGDTTGWCMVDGVCVTRDEAAWVNRLHHLVDASGSLTDESIPVSRFHWSGSAVNAALTFLFACETTQSRALEIGVEKVAIYVDTAKL